MKVAWPAWRPSHAPLRPEPLWLEWFALVGMLAFATWLMGGRGVWALLLGSDPNGITLVIIVVFVGATLWCGARSRELQRQREALESDRRGDAGDSWAADHWRALVAAPRDASAPLDLLSIKPTARTRRRGGSTASSSSSACWAR
jgi:hypothetical protein